MQGMPQAIGEGFMTISAYLETQGVVPADLLHNIAPGSKVGITLPAWTKLMDL